MKKINYYKDINNFNDNLALIDSENQTYSYLDLSQFAKNISINLIKRDMVFLIAENTVEFISAYIGFLQNENVIFLIDKNINEESLINLVNEYKPDYIFSSPRACLLSLDIRYEFLNYKLYAGSIKNSFKIHNQLACLLTTSGTTGSKKLVRLSYMNLISNADIISKYLNINSNDKVMTTMSPSYSYGLSIINSHLNVGAAIYLNEFSILQRDFWNTFKIIKPTNINGVPYFYDMIKKFSFLDLDTSFLNFITQAGGSMSSDTMNYMINWSKKKQVPLYIMYGQTEASPRMSYLEPNYLSNKKGSVGKAIEDGNFFLYDKKNNFEITENHKEGELIYKGPNVMMGYAKKNSDLVRGFDNNNILETGDLAIKDLDGFYYITGRIKRIIKILGFRINLDEIESTINAENIECACVGKDNNLIIYITDDKLIDDVKKIIVKKLKINKKNFLIKVIITLPRNENNKINYKELEIK